MTLTIDEARKLTPAQWQAGRKEVIVNEKKCSHCGEIKPIKEFNKDKCHCKDCVSKRWKIYSRENREKIRKHQREKYYENHEKSKMDARQSHKEYRLKNPERVRKQSEQWRKNNPEKVKKTHLKRIDQNSNWLWSVYPPKCSKCGYQESKAPLSFHHLNPTQKKSRIDVVSHAVRSLRLEKFKEYIEKTKFIVLCSNCHIRLHKGEIKLEEVVL